MSIEGATLQFLFAKIGRKKYPADSLPDIECNTSIGKVLFLIALWIYG